MLMIFFLRMEKLINPFSKNQNWGMANSSSQIANHYNEFNVDSKFHQPIQSPILQYYPRNRKSRK